MALPSGLSVLWVALGAVIGWSLMMAVVQPIFPDRPTSSPLIVPPTTLLCHREVPNEPPTHTHAERSVRWADYPKLVYLQTRTFDQLFDVSVGYEWLAQEVEEVEMAHDHLIITVAEDLVGALGPRKAQIIEWMRELLGYTGRTGLSLHSLGERIQGAADSITSLNRWASQTIEASKAPKAPSSLAARVLPSLLSNSNPTKEAIIETFILSMDNVGCHMTDIREEAEISMGHLTNLEERLVLLREVAHRDKDGLTKLLARLARSKGIFGQVRLESDLAAHKRKECMKGPLLDLLKKAEKWRKKALSHIVVTLRILHNFDADMEELRARVAALHVVGDKVPIKESIEVGTDRLREGQIRARLRQEDFRDECVTGCTASEICSRVRM